MLIKFDHIYKSFFSSKNETKVLDDISFEINENEIVSILGPSGCGKSTLLNIINSLIEPTRGTLTKNCKLGYMFQKDCLMPWRTIMKNITIGLEINKDHSKESLDYAKKLIEKYQLNDFSYYYPNEISGGMKQRVALIRTLVLKPDLLLLDEPFSALDAQTRLSVQEDVYNIIKEESKSALIVTHDISEALALSDRIIILSSRPTKIKNILPVEFKELKPMERRSHPHFSKYYQELCKELNIFNQD